jgi:CheY-like chemotaxis protein
MSIVRAPTAAEDMTKLFQPFVQLDSRLNRQYTGTGLGLSLVARLAQAHGGSVAVESTPGQGSRFRVILPWATGLVANRVQDTTGEERTRPAVAVPAPPRGAPDARGARVLLAEDNAMNLTMLTDYLQAKGYRVSAASTGREVLERVQEERPAVILMDIQMPDMDGLATIQQLQADPVLHTIPIIALTALAMPGDRERCLNAGARAYLAERTPM